MLQVFLVTCLLANLPAQDPEPTSFMLRNKSTLTGRVVGIEGNNAVLDISMMGGSATIRRSLAEFTPESVFRIRMAAAPPKTFEDHLKMAKIALELGILPQVGEHAGQARKLAESDGTGAQKKQLDAWAADTLESLFAKAVQEGDLVEARHYLKLLATRVPEERTEAQMGRMFDDLADAEAKRRLEARAATVAKEATARLTELEQLWQPIVQRIDRADELVKEGLRNSRNTVQATRSYERAVEQYKATWGALQEAAKKQGADPVAQEDAGRLAQRIQDGAVSAALHMANALSVQTDYKSALEWANKVLSIDPGNADAKALIRTIQIAQTSGGGWGRGWGR